MQLFHFLYGKFLRGFLICGLLCLPNQVLAQEEPPVEETEEAQPDGGYFNVNSQGWAIQGFDPVAYFKEDHAVQGSLDYQYQWKKAVWLFSSQTNKRMFANEPEKYAPQYGGFCAYCMSVGTMVDINPQSFSIIQSRLYLNVNETVRKAWDNEFVKNAQKANINWAKLKRQLIQKRSQ